MLFNSVEFFVFLAILYVAYLTLRHRGQNTLLLIGSYIFYGWWDVRFLFLIVVSTVVDYWCGLLIDRGTVAKRERGIASTWLILSSLAFLLIDWKVALQLASGSSSGSTESILRDGGLLIFCGSVVAVILANLVYTKFVAIEEARRRKLALLLSVVVNLGILSFFKYFNFFIENIEDVIAAFGGEPENFRLDIVLPVGISFYTFQTMSYTIDVYRRRLEATSNFFDFALFVSFFPQLVAGPIERAVNLIPQVCSPRRLSRDQTFRGLHLILYGLFKKVAIADSVARTVDQVYGSSGAVSFADVVIGTVFFAVQIYGDFSGYSDIARGTAKLLGFDLMMNFRNPYFSQNPKEFWTRWHISLSSWLRDYLYFSLGGNRGARGKTYRNLLATMLLGGLWHGAAWNFVFWGLYQGTILCIHRMAMNVVWVTKILGRVPVVAKMICFFGVTCYGWLLFRATSVGQIGDFTWTLLTDVGNLDFGASPPRAAAVFALPVLGVIELVEFRGNRPFYQSLPIPIWTGVYAVLLLGLAMGLVNEAAQFIYFVF